MNRTNVEFSFIVYGFKVKYLKTGLYSTMLKCMKIRIMFVSLFVIYYFYLMFR